MASVSICWPSWWGVFLPPGWIVRQEKSLDLDRLSRPEPDIVVAVGPRTLYRGCDPTVNGVGLIIEVSDSSYRQDRGMKWRRYAAAQVPIYGILNLAQRRMEIYRDPAGKGKDSAYREATNYDETAEFPLVLQGGELGRIAVKDLLA